MTDATFTVGETASLVGIEAGRIRGWQQHQHISFGTKGRTGRYRFSLRDVRCIALMAKLVDHGIEPGLAARWAAIIVDRSKGWPLLAVFSRDPMCVPCLVPEDSIKLSDAHIVVPLGPLFAEIDARMSR